MVLARANRCCMSDPTFPDPIRGGDRIRALEDDRFNQRRVGSVDGLEGLREISTAWYENRSTAYLAKKSWSDPIARLFFLVIVGSIIIGLAILLKQ